MWVVNTLGNPTPLVWEGQHTHPGAQLHTTHLQSARFSCLAHNKGCFHLPFNCSELTAFSFNEVLPKALPIPPAVKSLGWICDPTTISIATNRCHQQDSVFMVGSIRRESWVVRKPKSSSIVPQVLQLQRKRRRRKDSTLSPRQSNLILQLTAGGKYELKDFQVPRG